MTKSSTPQDKLLPSPPMAGVESCTPVPAPVKDHQKQPVACLPGLLYKAFFVLVLVFLLPLFPSQAPEFLNQTLLTRGWELLHLLLVGVAVSYGLFSRRNADQVDDKDPAASSKNDTSESFASQLLELPPVFDDGDADTPVGLERGGGSKKAQMWSSRYHGGEPTVVVAQETFADRTAEVSKPLFLPVRSLKSIVFGHEAVKSEEIFDRYSKASVESRSDSLDRTGSGRFGDGGRFGPAKTKETGEGAVLPSPIPWRSRSERMELRAEPLRPTTPSHISVPPPEIESGARVSRTHSFRSRPPSKLSSSHSPSPSPSPRPSRSSFSSEVRSKNIEDVVKKKNHDKSSPPLPPPPPPPLPPQHFYSYRSQFAADNSNQVKRSFKEELKDLGRAGGEGKTAKNPSHALGSVQNPPGEQPLRRAAAAAASKVIAEKKIVQSRRFIIDSEDDTSDSDSDASESSAEANTEEEEEREEASSSAEAEAADGNEVDKKADEFIAKFREQIRLQRIESIKKSAGQKRGAKNQNQV